MEGAGVKGHVKDGAVTGNNVELGMVDNKDFCTLITLLNNGAVAGNLVKVSGGLLALAGNDSTGNGLLLAVTGNVVMVNDARIIVTGNNVYVEGVGLSLTGCEVSVPIPENVISINLSAIGIDE